MFHFEKEPIWLSSSPPSPYLIFRCIFTSILDIGNTLLFIALPLKLIRYLPCHKFLKVKLSLMCELAEGLKLLLQHMKAFLLLITWLLSVHHSFHLIGSQAQNAFLSTNKCYAGRWNWDTWIRVNSFEWLQHDILRIQWAHSLLANCSIGLRAMHSD